MAVVDFNQINFTTKFEDLDVGTYFKFEGELFVKLRIAKEEDDAYGDEGEEVNAFSFTTDETTFFEDYDKVIPIPTEAIRICVGGCGD
jgi:hypothetical protein